MRNIRIAMLMIASLLMSLGLGCGEPYERPEEAEEIVSDEQLERFENEAGVPVYGGDSPPDIAATYLFEDREVLYSDSDDWPNFEYWCHSETTYEQTGTEFRYESSSESPNCDSSSEGNVNYISGDGDCFTLYTEHEGEFEGCYGESLSIRSACLNADGDMENPIGGTIATYNEDSSECAEVVGNGQIPAEGDMTATKQEDELAPRID